MVLERKPGQPPKSIAMGADGIAIGSNGKHLDDCPLASRHLYRVPTDAPLDDKSSEEELGKAVEDLTDRGFASDDKGRVYLTAYEHNAILRRTADGQCETVAHDPRMLWPDTLSVAADGHLYFTANQLHRQPNYQNGTDLREKPYSLFRVEIDAGPVLLQHEK